MRRRLSSRRASFRSRGARTGTCIGAGRGRSASTRGSRRRRSRTQRYRYLLASGQTGLSVAFDLPTQLGYDSDDPRALGEVGRTGVAIDSLADMELLLAEIPLGKVSTSMTINAPASLLLLLYELVAEGQGVPAAELRGTVQNDILKEYIARGNYIFPPRPSMRLTTDLFAYCAERIPSWNTISISGYHIREAGSTAVQELAFTLGERDRLLRRGGCGGAVAGRVRRAAVVLLQRAQRLLPGGREVPGGAAVVGADHARPVRRDEPEGTGAALPRADRRLDADGAAAREQHRQGRDAGAGRGLRRRPVAAHELLRRGAGAADRACRDDRAAHAADPPARGRDDGDGRPARRLLLHRGADRRARPARERADRAGARGGRRRRGRRERASSRARSRPPPTAGSATSNPASG